ncbi:GMC oxidoreductase [Oidiodendron maius Zn]|uniref:GMC oxidoreductase n=1 Tax=Oidiodendron maius (strain Zn) TaxID=913774 RepID=A0A0C3GWB4_OIDMZ|nr:GMC oxidoreductase [Oidiodendron maius Zn]
MAELPATDSLCKDATSFLSSPFDYLIIGGGTGGLVLAARLAETNAKVGILEAGKLRLGDLNIESLGGMSAMLNNADYDWAFKSVPQQSSNCRILHIARGKVVGGSSAINFMAYVRPNAEDIDSWNMEGWSWADLEPYYHKSETSYQKNREDWPESCVLDAVKHGTAGPIHTSFPVWRAPIEDSILQAFADKTDLPFPPTADPMQGSHLGFFGSSHTVDRSQAGKVSRSYATTGYLVPILQKKNMKILTEATVSKIHLERDGSSDQSVSAKGISFEHRGVVYKALANREVILCCSSIQSPRLLELSGVGNPEVLSAAGIDCVVNLPSVGENLQEHPMTSIIYELTPGKDNDNITLDSLFLNPDVFAEHQRLLAENQTGMLASPAGLMGFVPYATQVDKESLEETVRSVQELSAHHQDNKLQSAQANFIVDQLRNPASAAIQYIGFPANVDIANAASNQSLLVPGPRPGRHACYSFLISSMYPVSRGSSHIISSSESLGSSPRIDLGILSHPVDLDVLAAGLAFVDRIISPSSSFQSECVKGKIAERVDPAPEIDVQDPAQAKDFIRDRTMIFNHILGTCAMGQVVDTRLRVKGVAGLRVVDASVIPSQISGNIIATVYAIAEKAADLIKEDYHHELKES